MAYVILFSFEPFFSTYVDQPVRLLGLSPLTDQKLAGVVMMIEQIATVGVAFVLLLARRAPNAPGADAAYAQPAPEPSPWSFTFEPLFALLGRRRRSSSTARAWRREPARRAPAGVVRGGRALDRPRAQLAPRDDRGRTTSSSSTCSRT